MAERLDQAIRGDRNATCTADGLNAIGLQATRIGGAGGMNVDAVSESLDSSGSVAIGVDAVIMDRRHALIGNNLNARGAIPQRPDRCDIDRSIAMLADRNHGRRPVVVRQNPVGRNRRVAINAERERAN